MTQPIASVTLSPMLFGLLLAPLLWLPWYMFVLRPAAKRVGGFGPRWLSSLNARGAWFVAETLMQIPLSVNYEEACKSGTFDKQVLVVFHPHGAFCGTALMFGGWYFYALSSAARQWYVCVADILFRFPGLSEFLLVNNSRAADKDTMSKLLSAGHTVAVQPGGIYEQVRWDADHEKVYFPRNLGFVRLALEYGVPLLPIYTFGENQLYRQNAITKFLNNVVYKTTGAGVFFVSGRYGLPWIWPRRVQLHWIFGEAIDVGPQTSDPSDERVQEVFKEYVRGLRKLWDQHAKEALPEHIQQKGLQIVWRGHEDESL